MLSWALAFFVLAIIAAVLGFGGVAGAAAGIAKILFFVFLVLLVISAAMSVLRGQAAGLIAEHGNYTDWRRTRLAVDVVSVISSFRKR